MRLPLSRLLRRQLLSASKCRGYHQLAASSRPVSLSAYAPFPWNIDRVTLDIELGNVTTVRTRLAVSPKDTRAAVLQLDGSDLELLSVSLDGTELSEGDDYELLRLQADHTVLELQSPPPRPFEVAIVTKLRPEENTRLEGLYQSSGTFCTQCEAEGFRRITYFPDRPDVLSVFTTKLVADRARCPVLLSNGTRVACDEDLPGGRHSATWHDPWPKPAYLFALVGGNLVAQSDTFRTLSGKDVELHIWTERHNASRTAFAMESLKQAMEWDETRFGLEYDLDLYNIVAVDDFNSGAMENKSLNIFNSRLVLASAETATDLDYERIQGVIGHEYFHNYSGNRVTCRDWFQLSLKEGLTVYRDQEFTSDLNNRAVKRISDVRLLRETQFSEDASTFAHPVRPTSYEKIDNFYSATVYEKGAEIIRMYNTLLGEDNFRRGCDLYFSRHDGEAVTTDDFMTCMADTNPEFEYVRPAFARWYDQAGTPELTVEWGFDAGNGGLTLVASQRTPPTPDVGGDVKLPVCIPLAVGLVERETGTDLTFSSGGGDLGGCVRVRSISPGTAVQLRGGGDDAVNTTVVLVCTEERNEFVFEGLPAGGVVPSLLRGFSAPVRLVAPQLGASDSAFLLVHDSDHFNRAEAAVLLFRHMIADCVAAGGPASWKPSKQSLEVSLTALRRILTDCSADDAFKALALEPPTMTELIDGGIDGSTDPVALFNARDAIITIVAEALRPELKEAYARCRASSAAGTYHWTPEDSGARALASRCLRYLVAAESPAAATGLSVESGVACSLAVTQFDRSTCMTDSFSALAALNHTRCDDRDIAMASFLRRWKDDPNVVVKYLALEASSDIDGNTRRVRAIFEGDTIFAGDAASAFEMELPNKVYALCRSFAGCIPNFHAADGSGYTLLADMVLAVDKINPQAASRIAAPFTKWLKYDAGRRRLLRLQLERMLECKSLSLNTREIVSKSLLASLKKSSESRSANARL